ncbi:MAG: hypothetical protein AAB276_06245 [Pseudomonadota bacterium]
MCLIFSILFGGAAYKKMAKTSNSSSSNLGSYQGAPQSQGVIDAIALAKFRASVNAHEGYRLDVYRDSKGILTVGIGHKVLSSDRLKIGDKITPVQVQAFFEKDTASAFAAAKKQAKELSRYTADFIAALAEVNYQLGTSWSSKFYNTYGFLKSGNFKQAIENLLNSDWALQTPVRVHSFVAAIKSEYDKNIG